MLGEAPDRPIDRRHEATRREILEAARSLCREQGLADWSLRELAQRVGMRAPSLYSYFGSKLAIHDALFAEGQRALLDHMASVPTAAAGRERLRSGARAYFEFCVADPVRYQLLFQRTVPGFVPSESSYALAVEFLELTAAALRDAGATAPHHLDLWTALVTGLIAQQLANDPSGRRWAHLLDEAVDMFCDHAGVPAARRTTPRRSS